MELAAMKPTASAGQEQRRAFESPQRVPAQPTPSGGQPTPVTVHHSDGVTTYHVGSLTFAKPKDAIRAADAIDRHGRWVSPLRSTADDSTTGPLGATGARGDGSAVERSGATTPTLPGPVPLGAAGIPLAGEPGSLRET